MTRQSNQQDICTYFGGDLLYVWWRSMISYDDFLLLSHTTHMRNRYNVFVLIYFIISKMSNMTPMPTTKTRKTKYENVYASLDLHTRNGLQTTTKKSIRMHAWTYIYKRCIHVCLYRCTRGDVVLQVNCARR